MVGFAADRTRHWPVLAADGVLLLNNVTTLLNNVTT
jgi:hypothetical protein